MVKLTLSGATAALAKNVTDHWLLGIRQTNPAILHMFRERNIIPYRDLLPWSGEFAGKYITGCYYTYKITSDTALLEHTLDFIDELLTCQDTDGYLGCFSDSCKLTGAFSQSPEKTGENWDAWNHYHIMYGLLLWYDETGDVRYWASVLKMAALFISLFYGDKKALSSIGSTEMNLAVYHLFAILYRRTGEEKYGRFAQEMEEDMRSDSAGDYLSVGLSGMEFYQCKKPRWESLHVIMGFAEMYRATGDEKYLKAVDALTDSILRTDVHNTGGFSTREQAVGNPFSEGPIETCCVLAYDALVKETWLLTHKVHYIDLLEIAHYNAMLGCFSVSGLWSTYDTPMAGTKKASFHDIVFQARPGSPMLNCCSVNAPRGISEIGQWILHEEDDILWINSFEALTYSSENTKLSISGGFPYDGKVQIDLSRCEKPIRLRIPSWSKSTCLTVDGSPVSCAAGEYVHITPCTHIEINLDMSPKYLAGGLDLTGKNSVYLGCILMAADAAMNPALRVDDLPSISRKELEETQPLLEKDGFKLCLPSGITLTDFYHAGQNGSRYTTWLPVEA